MGRVEGKVAIITGAAAGIGASAARLLAEEGAKIVVTTRKKLEEGEALVGDIKRVGGEAIFIKLDVSKEEDWQNAIDETIQKYGKLNVIVNNAAISVKREVEETSLEVWNLVMEINAAGVFLGTKLGIDTMKSNGEPCSIINISSAVVHINETDSIAYNAAKGAIGPLTKTAAMHCCEAGYNIRVNTISPGVIYTPMIDQEANDKGMTSDQYIKSMVKRFCPIGHLGEPNDIAYAVLYLASDESKFVTGADLVVDGGITAK